MNDIEESGRHYAINLTRTLVLPKIVEYLDNRFPGCGISVDELMDIVSENTTRSTQSSPSRFDLGPSPSFSNTSRNSTNKIGSVSKKHKPELIYEKPEEGVKCIYVYTRPPRKGTYCGKPCVEGLKYCKYCKNKKKKNNLPARSSSSKTKAPAKKKEEEALTVEVYHNLEKYFLHPETNFILHEDEQTICAIAKELENGELRSLTEEEKVEARKSTLVTISDKDKEAEALSVLTKLIGGGMTESEKQEEKHEKQEVDLSSKSIPIDEEPFITKTTPPVPVIPEIREVPSF